MDLPDDLDFERCTYCGKQIPADIVQCPHCRNFTDGQGPLAGKGRTTWRSVSFLVIALIAIAAFLAMIIGGC